MCIFTQLSVLFALTSSFLYPKPFYCADKEVCHLCFFSQDKDSGPSESSEVRIGKWKVPSTQDYLALYKSLLDCDQLKVQLCCFFVWYSLLYILPYIVFSYSASLLTTTLTPLLIINSILDGYHWHYYCKTTLNACGSKHNSDRKKEP